MKAGFKRSPALLTSFGVVDPECVGIWDSLQKSEYFEWCYSQTLRKILEATESARPSTTNSKCQQKVSLI